MQNRANTNLFATNRENDRPLFFIFLILGFLACFSLLGLKAAIKTGKNWQDNLGGKITIMLDSSVKMPDLEKARAIIIANEQIKNAQILDAEYGRELLRPWLGNIDLPDNMPIPRLIEAQTENRQNLNTAQLGVQLKNAGFKAKIDTHKNWADNINKTLDLARFLSIIIILMLATIVSATALFASRASITGQKQTIDVLRQIGAPPELTARLLAMSLGKFGLKAGFLGAFGALGFFILLRLIFFAKAKTSILPAFHLSLADMALLLIVPAALAMLIAFVSWRTIMKMLGSNIY